MMPTLRWVSLIIACCITPIVSAADSATAGAAKAAVCTACHGPNGNSVNPQWPNLAGQNAVYIVAQLQLFKANQRINSNGIMPGLAATLNPQDMQDLGAYFALQTPTGLEADPSYWQAGEKLYRGGDKTRDIPACMACHGPVGRGNPDAGYPQLRAQHAVYTVKELTEYASDMRYAHTDKGDSAGGPKAAIMHTIAGRLSSDDIRNVASYLQGMR